MMIYLAIAALVPLIAAALWIFFDEDTVGEPVEARRHHWPPGD
jgi:hypothetical protein